MGIRDKILQAAINLLSNRVFREPGVPELDGPAGASSGTGAEALSDGASVIVALVEEAQKAGELAVTLDSQRSAKYLLWLLEGASRESGQGGPRHGAKPIVAFWWSSVSAGEPARAIAEAGSSEEPPSASAGTAEARARGPSIVALDVRPTIAAGGDPLSNILRTLQDLPADGLLRVTAPFRPRPLIDLLSRRGYRLDVSEGTEGAWELSVRGPGAPELMDLRDFEAPEPLERVLMAAATLEVSQSLIALLPRVPRLLLPRLSERRLTFYVHEERDGSALLHVRR